MPEGASSAAGAADAIHVLVLCLHHDMGANCVQTVCPDAAEGKAHALVDGQHFDLDVYASEPRQSDGFGEKVAWADVVVLLVRFMDVISIERIQEMLDRLPARPPLPMAAFLLREDAEVDFKMSCPSCGQKLWVRDTDEGKRGRCPNCKKAFRLPAQAEHARTELELPARVPVTLITRGNPSSCRKALGQVKSLLGAWQEAGALDPDTLRKSTVRIEIQDRNGDG